MVAVASVQRSAHGVHERPRPHKVFTLIFHLADNRRVGWRENGRMKTSFLLVVSLTLATSVLRAEDSIPNRLIDYAAFQKIVESSRHRAGIGID